MEPLGENNVNNNVETMAADHIQTEINPLEPLGKNHLIEIGNLDEMRYHIQNQDLVLVKMMRNQKDNDKDQNGNVFNYQYICVWGLCCSTELGTSDNRRGGFEQREAGNKIKPLYKFSNYHKVAVWIQLNGYYEAYSV